MLVSLPSLRNDTPLWGQKAAREVAGLSPGGACGAREGTMAAHLGALHLPVDPEQKDAGACGRHGRGRSG